MLRVAVPLLVQVGVWEGGLHVKHMSIWGFGGFGGLGGVVRMGFAGSRKNAVKERGQARRATPKAPHLFDQRAHKGGVVYGLRPQRAPHEVARPRLGALLRRGGAVAGRELGLPAAGVHLGGDGLGGRFGGYGLGGTVWGEGRFRGGAV